MTGVFTKSFVSIIIFSISIIVFSYKDTICQSDPDSVIHSQTDSVVKSKPKVKINHKEKSDSGFYIFSGDGKSYLNFKSEIRINGALDFNGLQDEETFDVYDIPLGSLNTNDTRFYIGVFQTRFGMEAKVFTKAGHIYSRLEGDFLGSNNSFRIRQAFVKLNSFLIGKTRSLFGDPDAMPSKVDRDGPNFSLTERTIQVRFEPQKTNNLKWGVALETPDPNITNPDSAEINPYYQTIPEIVSFIKKDFDNGDHLRLSGIFRNITVRNLDQELEIIQGYGGLFSGLVDIFNENKFMFQLFAGRSMAKYIKAFKGEGQDIIFDNIENVYKPVYLYGGFISLFHPWTPKISSDVTAGFANINNIQSQPGSAFKKGFYGSVNLFFKIIQEIQTGIEYSIGKKISYNDQSGSANRLSFIIFFYF